MMHHNHIMSPIESTAWSSSIQQQTRQALLEMPVTVDGLLHLKHQTLGFAYVPVDALGKSPIIIYEKSDEVEIPFENTDSLLQAGWVID